MSSACLQVKAFLLKEGAEEGRTEIRRFRMEGRENGGGMGGRQLGLLPSLQAHVHSVFNVNTDTQRCTLFWKDNDGDLVQFSTEEELAHALDARSDDTLRLYVTLSEGDVNDADQQESAAEDHMTERHVTFNFAPEEYCTDPDTLTKLRCRGMGRRGKRAECRVLDAENNKEFKEVRQQVPMAFRRWVRQYVRTWATQGPEAAHTSIQGGQLPEGVGHDLPQWLDTVLHRHHGHACGDGAEEMEVEGMMEGRPEGLPPVYFRWLTLFLPRFHACLRRRGAASADFEGEEMGGACGGSHKKRCHRGHGQHGCHGKKGGKHGRLCASSESEDSDSGLKMGKQVPKEFRKYARVAIKQLHKNKGDNSDNKEKATRAGIPAEVQEFVEQILLELHAKMASRHPRAIAMEMMAGERTLPAGMEQGHFLWLCRFLARWHRRHAGKCEAMSGWSSGDSTDDGTSGEEEEEAAVEEGQGDAEETGEVESSAPKLGCGGRRCHGEGSKGRRALCREMKAEKNREFKEVRQQVPMAFRRWVRQYVRTWATQGPEAAHTSIQGGQLPEGVGHDLPQWLDTVLHRHHGHACGDGAEEMEVEGMMEGRPEGLPPVYFRWLTLFLPRFHACLRQRGAASADSEGEEMEGACSGDHRRRCHRGHGQHGCHGKKGGKHGGLCISSESEDSDSGLKARNQVPKEFRRYARVTVNQLHKNKGNNSDNKEKATRAGISAEAQEFVEQIVLELHAKMASKRPRAIAMEMMAGERTLPAGMEQGHFLWLCRFLARWHRRHAGKCEAMSGWSSGETTSADDTSGEECTAAEEGQVFGPWPGSRRELRAAMRMARHGPFFMPPGVGYPCHGPPAFGWGRGGCGARRGCWAGGRGRPWGGQRGRGQWGAARGHCPVNHMTDRFGRM